MTLRPTSSILGRTYKWYTGEAVVPFGYGQHYTNFSISWRFTPSTTSSDISSLVNRATGFTDLAPFASLTVNVIGGPANLASDYASLLFLSLNQRWSSTASYKATCLIRPPSLYWCWFHSAVNSDRQPWCIGKSGHQW
jgi:hypothetical protein